MLPLIFLLDALWDLSLLQEDRNEAVFRGQNKNMGVVTHLGKGSCPLWHHKGKHSDWVSFGTHFEMGDESKGWTSSNLWKVHWRLEKECRQIWNTGCNLTLLILCVPSVPHPAERANPCTSTQRGQSISAAFLQRPQVLIAFRAPRVGSDQHRVSGRAGPAGLLMQEKAWIHQEASQSHIFPVYFQEKKELLLSMRTISSVFVFYFSFLSAT